MVSLATRQFKLAIDSSLQQFTHQFLNHRPMHIGQPSVDPVALHGQPSVVEPQLVQDGGVHVVDWGGCGLRACRPRGVYRRSIPIRMESQRSLCTIRIVAQNRILAEKTPTGDHGFEESLP